MNNDPKIVLSAVDKTKAAFSSVERGLNGIGTTGKKVQAMFSGFERLAGITALSGTLATLSLPAIAADVARTGENIARMSQVANASTDAFQRMAYGAKSVGIENDKLADILKDVNDKVGEFVSSGGGPMKDFFEQVAPKVGLTADAFANLSGPQALQKYYDALQKANLSQAQMTFYMEALGNDATALIPLLRDGGKGFQEMGDQADRFGAVMDDKAIAASREFQEKLRQLEGALNGVKITIGNEVIPAINRLSSEFLLGIKYSDGFLDALLRYGLTNPFEDMAGKVRVLRNEFEQIDFRLSNGRSADPSADRERLRTLEQEIGYYSELLKLRDGSQTPSVLPQVTVAAKPLAVAPKGAKKDDQLGDLMSQVAALDQPLQKFIQLQQDAAVAGADLTAAEREFYNLINDPSWDRMPEPWRALAREQFQAANAAEKTAAEEARLNDLIAATPTAQLEKQREQMQFLADAFENGRINAEQFNEAATVALGNVPEEGKAKIDDLGKAIESWGNKAADVFADFAVSGKASFSDLVESILADIVRLQAKKVFDPVVEQGSGFLANIIGGLFGGGGGSTATQSFSGGGVATGPTSGYPATLHGTEAVIPIPNGSVPVQLMGGTAGAQVLINVNNNASETRATATSSTDANGNAQIEIMIERIESGMSKRLSQGSGLAPVLERRYGLNAAAGAMR